MKEILLALMMADMDVLEREHGPVAFATSRPREGVTRVVYRAKKRVLIEVDYKDPPTPAKMPPRGRSFISDPDYLRPVADWEKYVNSFPG